MSRDTGQITEGTSLIVPDAMAIMDGPNAKVVSMSDPTPMKNLGKDTFAVTIYVPIINCV